jgi:hypothetical protein
MGPWILEMDVETPRLGLVCGDHLHNEERVCCLWGHSSRIRKRDSIYLTPERWPLEARMSPL